MRYFSSVVHKLLTCHSMFWVGVLVCPNQCHLLFERWNRSVGDLSLWLAQRSLEVQVKAFHAVILSNTLPQELVLPGSDMNTYLWIMIQHRMLHDASESEWLFSNMLTSLGWGAHRLNLLESYLPTTALQGNVNPRAGRVFHIVRW